MDILTLLFLGFQISLVLIVLSAGMGVERREETLRPRSATVVRSVVAMQVLAPALAIALALTVPLESAVRIALVALAVSPVPPFVPHNGSRVGGPGSYVVVVLAASALVSMLTIPSALSLLSDVFGLPLSVSTVPLAKLILLSVLLPLLVGLLIARVAPAFSATWASAIGWAGVVVLVLTMLPQVVVQLPAIRTLASDGTVVVMAAYAAATLLIGHLLGGPKPGSRAVLAMSTAARHPAIALALAQANFPDERLVTPAVLLLVIVTAVASASYAVIARRRYAGPLTAAPLDGRQPLSRRS